MNTATIIQGVYLVPNRSALSDLIDLIDLSMEDNTLCQFDQDQWLQFESAVRTKLAIFHHIQSPLRWMS